MFRQVKVMHELSVTQGLLKICLEEGKKHNIKKIKDINIKVGELTDLVPNCISYYFNIISKDTIAENAKINIDRIQVEIKCNVCGYFGKLGKNNYLCPSCKGNKYEIIKGREFYLDTMEVE
ncbi:hydrogenase maturation nickel metallochaperone HypA [uncultured Clostridium sp.]|uniref:hydrogenase maturation nickel metallochaperone HypA n=2 Tax=Clostridium TaxID=1485 RepID=UPI00262B7D8D|nr:hydrogenase maturation nickel metallochaperone HypA [uncultured Clostridium sp.]